MCKRVLLMVLIFLRSIIEANNKVLTADSTYQSSDSCIVFVTTREVKPQNGEYVFGNSIAKDQELRFYNIYFKAKEARIAPRRTLEDALDNANISSDFMLYTEGHGKLFYDNVERGIHASRIYAVSVIMFDWPSKVPGYAVEKDFHTSLRNARSVTKQFNELLLALGEYRNNAHKENITHLSMFFHSMGNAVMLSTLRKYGAHKYNSNLADNIIFNAPCVPSRGHHKLLEQLSFQKNIYVMYNKKDPALKGATFLLGTFILGSRPMRLAKNASYFDLKKVARISHNCFLRSSILNSYPQVQDIYNDLFHSRTLNVHDVCIESVGGTNNNFCVF